MSWLQSGHCVVNSFHLVGVLVSRSGTENGICLITKIPALLSRHSLEGAWWKLGDMREQGMWVTGQRKEQYARGTCFPGTDRRPVWLKEVSHRNNQGQDTWGQGMDFGFYSQSDGKTFGGF